MPKAKPPKDYVEVVDIPTSVELCIIGHVRSPYRERHGTPRQGLGTGHPDLQSELIFHPDKVPESALMGLETFDLVWVIAWLHLNQHWNPTVVPPRGPRVRRGVLSTRAPHRPNPIGLTAAKVVSVKGHVVTVSGCDLLDTTPILDIKPYIPYADAFERASAGWVDDIDGRDPSKGPGRTS